MSCKAMFPLNDTGTIAIAVNPLHHVDPSQISIPDDELFGLVISLDIPGKDILVQDEKGIRATFRLSPTYALRLADLVRLAVSAAEGHR